MHFSKYQETVIWPFPENPKGNWKTLCADEAIALLSGLDIDGDILSTRARPLEFYSGHLFVQVMIGPTEDLPASILFLIGGESLTVLDGKPLHLHNLNASAPLQINNAQQAEAYLRTYSTVVWSDHGMFEIIDDYSQISWTNEDDAKPYQELAKSLTKPVAFLDGMRQSDLYWFYVTIHFGTYLFNAVMEIKKSGHVRMVEDFPFNYGEDVTELPIRDQARHGKLRLILEP